MSIPIQNVYYLLCYAWGYLPTSTIAKTGVEESPDLQDLLAKVLIHGSQHLVRRGLDREYVELGEDTNSPRGRIDFAQTLQRSLLRAGRVHCHVDHLIPDIPQNQILKTTIGRLARSSSLDHDNRKKLGLVYRQLSGISEVRLSRQAFRRIQLYNNNGYYRFLLHICELVYAVLLPTSGEDGYDFFDVLEDETRMSAVFEAFVRNFYRLEQVEYKLGPRTIKWDIDWATETAQTLIPDMVNDIRLDSADQTILIDTKYYRDALKQYYGAPKFHSPHLYQIFSYLKNLRTTLPTSRNLQGILLYPAAAKLVDCQISVQNLNIRIVTINLDQHWRHVRSDLLSLLHELSPTRPAHAPNYAEVH